MASLLIIKAQPFASVSAPIGTGASNLLTPDPREVFTATSGQGSYAIDLDMGASVSLDSFFAGFIVGSAAFGGQISSVKTGTGMGTGLSANLATTQSGGVYGSMPAGTGRRRHAFVRLAAPASSRYWRVTVELAASATLGIVAAGLAIQPLYGREWGSGRSVDDRSSVTPLIGGGYGIERGARVPGFQWTLGDLSDAETETLWNVVDDIGQSAPLVVVEDPDHLAGLQERLHWGLLDRPESYEREMPNLNRWALRIRGWN